MNMNEQDKQKRRSCNPSITLAFVNMPPSTIRNQCYIADSTTKPRLYDFERDAFRFSLDCSQSSSILLIYARVRSSTRSFAPSLESRHRNSSFSLCYTLCHFFFFFNSFSFVLFYLFVVRANCKRQTEWFLGSTNRLALHSFVLLVY